MNEILNYLKECGTFYLATTKGDQPVYAPLVQSVNLKADFTSRPTTRKKYSHKCRKTLKSKFPQ